MLATSIDFTCAGLDDGAVACWGSTHPEGSTGFRGSERPGALCGPTYVEIGDGRRLEHVIDLEAGAAIDASGYVWLWGGPAGRGRRQHADEPLLATRLAGVERARDVAVTGEVACVVTEDRHVTCFVRGSPVAVAFDEEATAIDCGVHRCCIITPDRLIRCLDETTLPEHAAAFAVDVRAIAVSGTDVCWLSGDAHDVWCFGATLFLGIELPGGHHDGRYSRLAARPAIVPLPTPGSSDSEGP